MQFKTYTINLDKNKDRWNLQSKILTNVNIKSERFSGYTFKDINKEEILNKFGLFYHLLSESMIGCAYSHLKVLEKFLKTNYKVCLILEDDAYPIFKDVKELNLLLTKIYDNILIEPWDIYSLHSDGFINDKFYNYKNLLTTSNAAYFITRQGAINLLKKKIITHSDLNININNLLGNIIKKIHIENLFYTNEELCSDNRKENINYNILDLIINNTLFNEKLLRGEKKWKHIRNHTFINIPFINYNLTNDEIIKKITILYFILINVRYPSKKNKFLFFLSILLITSNKNIII